MIRLCQASSARNPEADADSGENRRRFRSTPVRAGETRGEPGVGRSDAPSERVYTVDELSKHLNVSTKTISRWRQQGLVGFRFVSDGCQRVGFLESSVSRFVRENPERVSRGAEFHRLTDDERERLVERARHLADAGWSPSEVTKHLARNSGRSDETIRSVIKRFDREHPEAAIFPGYLAPLQEEVKRSIYSRFVQGEPVEALARQSFRSKASVRRIVAEMRVKWIAALPLAYMSNEGFDEVRSEKEILSPAPPNEGPKQKVGRPSGLPSYIAGLYEVPLLSRRQEAHLFRKMNYLKYKASSLREQLDPANPSSRLMDQIEKLHGESVATKNEILRANLRLVVSIVKRYAKTGEDFYDLISDGNMTLIRAVEKFDFSRGNKFSTYASWALFKNFARSIPEESRRLRRFGTGNDGVLLGIEDRRCQENEQKTEQLQRENEVRRLLSRLDDREQKVIFHRYGLQDGQGPLTLKEVGAMLGVSKERARQIEVRAMSRLREAAREERIDCPEIG
jgi:RNA polymerase primary sigma factor